jgi:hypothetical protein
MVAEMVVGRFRVLVWYVKIDEFGFFLKIQKWFFWEPYSHRTAWAPGKGHELDCRVCVWL